MKLDCSLVEDLYPLYEENELKPENRRAVEEHLKECKRCRELYQKGSGFSEVSLFPEEKEEKVSKELDDRIRLNFRLRRMKVIAVFLAAIIIVTGINRYAANREQVATLLNGMYSYSRSLNEIADRPYETNSELYLSDSIDDIIDLDNELNWLERNLFDNSSYNFFVDTEVFNEMLTSLKERKSQGLQDETDVMAIELLQKHSKALFQHVQSEYDRFHHGYSSYLEILDIDGIGEPINKIEELAYFYNTYHKLPSEMKLLSEKDLEKKIRTVFNIEEEKVELEKSHNNVPGVYRFEINGIHGEINGYSGMIFDADSSLRLNDKKTKDKKEVMEKAKQFVEKIYGNNAHFEMWRENIGGQPSIYRFRFVPLAGEYRLLFLGSEPYYIQFDAETGDSMFLAHRPMLTKEFFAKKYKEVLSTESIESKAEQVSGVKGKSVEKGIIYSTVSADYVLVHVFEGEDSFVYINAETGVVERPYVFNY
jgi:hypothetical protein